MTEKITKFTVMQAKVLARELQDATTDLNKSFKQVETALKELALGVRGSVDLPSGRALVYAKQDGEWGLRLTSNVTIGPVNDIPITSASREARLEAADHIVELVKKMLLTAKEQVDVVTGKVRSMNEILQFLMEEKKS